MTTTTNRLVIATISTGAFLLEPVLSRWCRFSHQSTRARDVGAHVHHRITHQTLPTYQRRIRHRWTNAFGEKIGWWCFGCEIKTGRMVSVGSETDPRRNQK